MTARWPTRCSPGTARSLQAWLVDAETCEIHPTLSRGQREHDLDIMVENVAMGMLDLAERLGRPEALQDRLIAEAEQVRVTLRDAVGTAARRARLRLHRPLPRRGHHPPAQRTRLRRRRGLAATGQRRSRADCELHVAVGDRRYHAHALQELTGLDVGEGQARILLGDLHAYQAQLCREAGHDVDERTAARLWVMEVVTPTEHLAHAGAEAPGTPIQAYCDLLEVRWLLSEQAGRDVGTNTRSWR